MVIKQLYNDDLRKLPNEYGDVSVMVTSGKDFQTFYNFDRGNTENNKELQTYLR